MKKIVKKTELHSNLLNFNVKNPHENDDLFKEFVLMTDALIKKPTDRHKIVSGDIFASLYLPHYFFRFKNDDAKLETVRSALVNNHMEIEELRHSTVDDLLTSSVDTIIIYNHIAKLLDELEKTNDNDKEKLRKISYAIEKGISQAASKCKVVNNALKNPMIRQMISKEMNGGKDRINMNDGEENTEGSNTYGREPGILRFVDTLTNLNVDLDVLLKIVKKGTELFNKLNDSPHGTYNSYRITSSILDAVKIPKNFVDDEITEIKMLNGSFITFAKKSNIDGYYILLDKSGSMGGEKIMNARAIAFALGLLAKQRKLKFMFRFFDDNVYDRIDKLTLENLAKIGSVDADGGTCISCALNKALEDLRNMKEFVIIIITDGEDEFDIEPLANAIKNGKHKLISVLIGNESFHNLTQLTKKVDGVVLTTENLDDKIALEILREVSSQ
jgi:uncharacterized protein YegL